MLKALLNLFSSDNRKYSFYTLYSNLTEWSARKYKPYPHELPRLITFPQEFWSRIIQLFKETRGDGLERAVSVFWADGELVVTPTTTGTANKVLSSSEISVTYTKSTHTGYLQRKITVNGKVYSKRDVASSKVPKKVSIQYLFNLHTHPPHQNSGVSNYSFFSEIDIDSFLSSSALVTGMIGDRLWLLFKTNKTPPTSTLIDGQINANTLTNQLQLAVYEGEFKSKLRKLLVSQL
jgi:hypothetical protein